MDRKSKYLIGALVILILASIVLTYKRSFVDKNYEIINEEEELE